MGCGFWLVHSRDFSQLGTLVEGFDSLCHVVFYLGPRSSFRKKVDFERDVSGTVVTDKVRP